MAALREHTEQVAVVAVRWCMEITSPLPLEIHTPYLLAQEVRLVVQITVLVAAIRIFALLVFYALLGALVAVLAQTEGAAARVELLLALPKQAAAMAAQAVE